MHAYDDISLEQEQAETRAWVYRKVIEYLGEFVSDAVMRECMTRGRANWRDSENYVRGRPCMVGASYAEPRVDYDGLLDETGIEDEIAGHMDKQMLK
jgi:hypothetical protein